MRSVTAKPAIAALAAIAVGALVYSGNSNTALSIGAAVIAGIVAYIVWGAFENLLAKGAEKVTEKAGDAITKAYRKHHENKTNSDN